MQNGYTSTNIPPYVSRESVAPKNLLLLLPEKISLR